MEAEVDNKKSWYRSWFNSPYYHQLYFKRDEQEAAAFIDRLVEKLKPIPSTYMLDVGCGRGRHSVQLAALGYNVTGIDISEDSIADAKQSEKDNLEFFVHDMRLPFRMNYYDYSFNFFTSFGFFRTRREHDNAIRTIAQSLKPNGTFVIDYLNAHFIESNLKYKDKVEKDGVTFHITRWLDETHFYKKIEVEDHANLDSPIEFTEKVAKFSLGDFNDILTFHNLQIQEVYGSYQFEPYHVNNSQRLIIIAKKVK